MRSKEKIVLLLKEKREEEYELLQWLSLSDISRETKLSYVTVQKAVNELVDEGILEEKYEGNRRYVRLRV